MKSKIVITILLVLLASSLAQAQITVLEIHRVTKVELYPLGDPGQIRSEDEAMLGPLFSDLELVDGDLRAHSVHESNIVLDGTSLTVNGTLFSEASDAAAPLDGAALAYAVLILRFSVDTESFLELDATVGTSGEVWFFDLTDNDYSFDNQGPGRFTLERTLVPGHEYLFQVHHGAQIGIGEELYDVANASMFLAVSSEPVAMTTESWDGIKMLFR